MVRSILNVNIWVPRLVALTEEKYLQKQAIDKIERTTCIATAEGPL